jgi:diacylglycerol kinase (ATP)
MIAFIINPVSGRARRRDIGSRVDFARAALASCGEEARVSVSEGRGHVRELASAALHSGARLVIVWGGDGTMNEAGSALLESAVPLAIIPAGSGNGLARELGIPLQPAAAITVALRATPRAIDAGELGGRPFFNVAGVGFDAHIAARFDRAPHRGLATYVRVSARALLTYRSMSYRIACGDLAGDASGDPERVALRPGRPTLSGPASSAGRRALLVTIANSPQFGNGARIAPRARVDDGRLDLVVYEEVSRFATLCALPRLFAGGIERVRGMTTQQIDSGRIESDAPMTFHVDGEPVEDGTALEIRVRPKALTVIA